MKITFTIRFQIEGEKKFWIAGFLFFLVGLFPFFIGDNFSQKSGEKFQKAKIISILDKDEYEKKISYHIKHEYISINNSPVIESGWFWQEEIDLKNNTIDLMTHPDFPNTAFTPSAWVVEINNNLVIQWILRFISFVFGSIGAVCLFSIISIRIYHGFHPEWGEKRKTLFQLNTLLGVMGFLYFTIPASCVYWFLRMLYNQRPNGFFPNPNYVWSTNETIIGVLFSTIGILLNILFLVIIVKKFYDEYSDQ